MLVLIKTNLAAGQSSWLTMDNELLPHLLCVFMRATSCHIFIVCVILFCPVLLLCADVCFCKLFRNTLFVSQCGVCVDFWLLSIIV